MYENIGSSVAAWLREHDGVIDKTHLIRLGISNRAIKRMISRGDFIRLQTGVFISAHTSIGPRQIMQAACQRNDAVAIGFTTAGQLWELRRMGDPRVHVLVPHGHSPQLTQVVVHRCRDVAESDIVCRPDGLRVTSPARSLFDASSIIGVERTESALEHALDRGLVEFRDVVEICERLARRRRPGSHQMRQVLGGRPHFQRAVQSDLEYRVLTSLKTCGLPKPITQFTLALADGRTIRFDFAWPQRRVALEVDHPFWHGGREAQHRDKERDRKVAALGWRVLRITDWDVASGMQGVARDLEAALRTA